MMRKIVILIIVMCASIGAWAGDTLAALMSDTLAVQDTLSLSDSTALAAGSEVAVDTVMAVVMPNLLDSMRGVEVLQDSAVARLLQVAILGNEEWIEITGYRVQVYSSNQQQKAKAEALRLEERLKDQLSQTVYVLYVPPFWKVRIGDFRTYDEAKEYKRLVVQQFPALLGDTYIVRDQIKVLK